MSAAAAPAAATVAQRPAHAEPPDELFEVLCPDTERVIGLQPRGKCHRQGLLHRAVYVWVFDSRGRLLIQRRSSAKSIGPNQWDLSVAEHLSPGEDFLAAAVRGLQEELGLDPAAAAQLSKQPLGPPHRRCLRVPGLVDNELVCSFRLDGFDGPVQANPAEVSEVAFVELGDLAARMAAEPECFTSWFRDEAALLQMLPRQDPPAAQAHDQAAAELN